MKIRLWQILTLALLAAGCAKEPPPPARLVATVAAAADLNPDSSGRPSPLVLKLYQLKAPGGFNGADFFTLHDQPEKVLAADLLGSEQLVLKPGQQLTLERELDPNTRQVGLLAAFRDIDHAMWRQSVTIVPHQVNRVRIELGGTTLTAHPGGG